MAADIPTTSPPTDAVAKTDAPLAPGYRISEVVDGDAVQLRALRVLFQAYTQMLRDTGCDVRTFQGFDKELASLPAMYAPGKGGRLYLVTASAGDTAAAGAAAAAVTAVTAAGGGSAGASGGGDRGGGSDGGTPAGAGAAPTATRVGVPPCLPGFLEDPALTAPELPGRAVACVAFKRVSDGTAELKRLFVAPTERGCGLGRLLSLFAMARAKEDGYSRMVLDTLARLPWAVRLYERLGYERVEAYVHNPMEDVMFFGIDL